jgi:predicted metal-dependent HD superfamily phosphohydrolase
VIGEDSAADRRLLYDGISLLVRNGATPAAARMLIERMLGSYREPRRRYHTTAHLHAVLATVDRLADLTDDPDTVRLAVWFHDLVYDPTRHDNEQASADLARIWLNDVGLPADLVEEVSRLVELTASHHTDTGDRNGMVLVDADLSILGAPVDDYDRYITDVRAEYAHLDDEEWSDGRAAVLRTFLAEPRLFGTDRLRGALETRARENLSRELTSLSGDGDPTP